MRFWFGVLLCLSVSCCTFVAMQAPLSRKSDEVLFGKDLVPELVGLDLPEPLPVLCLHNRIDEDDLPWDRYDATGAMAFLIEVGLPFLPQSSLLQTHFFGRDARIELGQRHPLCEEIYLTLQGPWLVQAEREDFGEQVDGGQTVGGVITQNIIDACVNINFRRLWRLWEQVPEGHCEGVRQALWIPYFYLRSDHPDVAEGCEDKDRCSVLLHWAAITKLIYADDPDCQECVEEADQWIQDKDVLTHAWNRLTEDRNVYYVPPK